MHEVSLLGTDPFSSAGRWLGRDPVGELAFVAHLSNRRLKSLLNAGAIRVSLAEYTAIENDVLNRIDYLGLFDAVMTTDRRSPEKKWDDLLWLLQTDVFTCFNTDISDWEELIRALEKDRANRRGNPKLDTLNLSSHGAVGGGGVATENPDNNLIVDNLTEDQIARLRELFSDKGRIKFWSCNCAGSPNGRERLKRLAELLNITVLGAEGDVASGDDGFFGWSLGLTDPRWYEFKPNGEVSVGTGSGRSKKK